MNTFDQSFWDSVYYPQGEDLSSVSYILEPEFEPMLPIQSQTYSDQRKEQTNQWISQVTEDDDEEKRAKLDLDVIQAAKDTDVVLPTPLTQYILPTPATTSAFRTYKIPNKSIKERKKKVLRMNKTIQMGLMSGLAFLNTPTGGCSLKHIYAFVCDNFEGFDPLSECWKKSIRHSLCTHNTVYVKDEGDGMWRFLDRSLYEQKLDQWVMKNPDVTEYGLKRPEEWKLIRSGKKGIPPIVERKQYEAVKKKTIDEHRQNVKKRRLSPDRIGLWEPEGGSAFVQYQHIPQHIYYIPHNVTVQAPYQIPQEQYHYLQQTQYYQLPQAEEGFFVPSPTPSTGTSSSEHIEEKPTTYNQL